MKIMTMGESPYRLTSNGKIHSDIIKIMSSEGHEVIASAWGFDTSWFLPDENEIHYYEEKNNKICSILPFINSHDKASCQIYEIMKKVQPKVVITVGDCSQTSFLFSIKAIYPDLFKWIAIMPIGAIPIEKHYHQSFSYMDAVIVTNKESLEEINRISNNPNIFYCSYGPDKEVMYEHTVEDKDFLRVMMVAKNDGLSNIPAFIKAVNIASREIKGKIRGYLHTNLYDKGFYDIESLVERYGNAVDIPSSFVSSNEGITDEELRDEYNKSHVIVDCSISSATGLTLLEGISCGCLPLFNLIGTKKDIFSEMENVPYLHSYKYVGRGEIEYSIVDPEQMAQSLLYLYSQKNKLTTEWIRMQRQSQNILEKYDKKHFFKRIKEIFKETVNNDSPLILEEIL